MANTIALVTQYLKDAKNAQEVMKEALQTVDLQTESVQFLGGDAVKLPKVTFGGALGTYSRATGHVANDITLAWETYTLTQDKGNKLLLDKMDDEEGMNAGIVPYFNSYIKQVVTPTVDTYRLNKLYLGNGHGAWSKTITTANVVSEMLAAQTAFQSNEISLENTIFYIKPAVYAALQASEEYTRYVNVGSWGNQVDLNVKRFGESKLVITNRLPANANFLLVQPAAVLGTVKHNPATLHTVVQGFDGYQIDYRIYHDLFVISDRTKGVYANGSSTDPNA